MSVMTSSGWSEKGAIPAVTCIIYEDVDRNAACPEPDFQFASRTREGQVHSLHHDFNGMLLPEFFRQAFHLFGAARHQHKIRPARGEKSCEFDAKPTGCTRDQCPFVVQVFHTLSPRPSSIPSRVDPDLAMDLGLAGQDITFGFVLPG